MKKIIFLLSLLLSINVMAQKQDSEDQYIFYEDETIKSILNCNGQTINAAMSAPSSALSSVGKWYAMYRGSDDYGTYYIVKKWRNTIYSPDGTGTFNREGVDEMNYKYVKRIDWRKSYPITWKKTGDRIRIVYDIKRMTWKSTKQNQLAKLTAAERQDWQNILSRAQSNERAKRMNPEEFRVIRIDSDFMLVDQEEEFVGWVSESGFQKLMRAREQAEERKKQQELEKQQQREIYKMNFYKSVSSCPDSNHPHVIDLGIGTLWSCCNVGANLPQSYGSVFQWGHTTESKGKFNKEPYRYYLSDRGFLDIGKNIAGTEFDVAHVKWGGKWRMPSVRDFQLLIKFCKTEVIEESENVVGTKFTGPNGNSIYLPNRFTEYFTSELFQSPYEPENNQLANTFTQYLNSIGTESREEPLPIRPVQYSNTVNPSELYEVLPILPQ